MSEWELERFHRLYIRKYKGPGPDQDEYIPTKYAVNKTDMLYLKTQGKNSSGHTQIEYLINDPSECGNFLDLDIFCEIMSMREDLAIYLNEIYLAGFKNMSHQDLAQIILRFIYKNYMEKLVENGALNG